MIIVGLDRMIKIFSFTRPPAQIKVLETGNSLNPDNRLDSLVTRQIWSKPRQDQIRVD